MASAVVAQLRELEPDELTSRLKEAKEQLFALRIQQATGQLDSYAGVKLVKRDIARIHTVLQERTLGIVTLDSTSATNKDD